MPRWIQRLWLRSGLAVLRIGLGVGLLAYLVESGIIDPRALAGLLPAWPLSVAAIALVVADLALMAWRLTILFRCQYLLLSWGDALRLTFIGSFFSNFLPGRAGGDLARIFYASRENAGRRPEIIAILLFDRVVGLSSLLLLPLVTVPFFPGLMNIAAIQAAIAVIGLLVLIMIIAVLLCFFTPGPVRRWMSGPDGFFAKLPGRHLAVRLLQTVSAYRDHPGALAQALGLALAANLVLIGILMLAVLIVDPASLEARLCVLIPIGQVVNSLPLTPGGLGVGESAFQALFQAAGAGGGANALICWRIWNFLAGLAGLVIYLQGFRAHIPRDQGIAPASPEVRDLG